MNDTILVAWDGSPASKTALREAVRLVGSGTILLFQSVGLGSRTRARLLPIRKALRDIARDLTSKGVSTRTAIGTGAPGAAIARAISRYRASLAIIGTRAIPRRTARSSSVSLLRRTRVPILVTRETSLPQATAARRVIVGIDFGPASIHAADEGARLARREGGFLTLVHVLPDSIDARIEVPLARARLERIAATLPLPSTSIDWFVCSGDPVTTLLAEAEGDPATLLVVGTRDRSVLRRSLGGSVAEEILRRAPGVVLVAHARGERGDLSLAFDGLPISWTRAVSPLSGDADPIF